MCGAVCACRCAIQLYSSLGPAREGNLGLVLAQVSLVDLGIYWREKQCPHACSSQAFLFVAFAAFSWDTDLSIASCDVELTRVEDVSSASHLHRAAHPQQPTEQHIGSGEAGQTCLVFVGFLASLS